MEFDNSFDVPLPPAQAWALLMDIPRIAPCMPGAELTEIVDPQNYKGKISVRLGPVALTFAGRVEFDQIDAASRTARVKAQGSDAKGRGGANADRDVPHRAGRRRLDGAHPYRSDAVGCGRAIWPRRRHDRGDRGADRRPVRDNLRAQLARRRRCRMARCGRRLRTYSRRPPSRFPACRSWRALFGRGSSLCSADAKRSAIIAASIRGELDT